MVIELAPKSKTRKYLPLDYVVKDWPSLEPHFIELEMRALFKPTDIEKWLRDLSEVEAVILEDMAWRYIKMTCDTNSEEKFQAYQLFHEEIMPEVAKKQDVLRRKLCQSPLLSSLDPSKYHNLIREAKCKIEIYREENVAILSELQSLAQQFGQINGSMSVEYEGEKITIQRASALLESKDSKLREEIWRKISFERSSCGLALDELFSSLALKRHEIAKNAGFPSFTDYAFKDMGRFDYGREDCGKFHDSIEKVITPIFQELMEERRVRLGLKRLRPWDLSVDYMGDQPLRPFENSDDLINGSIEILRRLKSDLGQMIELMRDNGFLDLDSRMGKSPGGYNYPLAETGVPFIFMNAVGTQVDLTTMLHEEGHAIHAFLTRDLELIEFQRCPSEVAELASMSMELISLDHLDVFYADPKDRLRARRDQLMRTLTLLPWIATVDAFQIWLYDHQGHSHEERGLAWTQIYERFHGNVIDWSGLEEFKSTYWKRQGHIFEVPFYYIEYGIAQLGAIAVWRNYKINPEKGLEDYLSALKLGYTKTIPEIYKTAGICFDFSEAYIRELAGFIRSEIRAMDN